MRCVQANLGLTLIMLFFTVIGKLMGLAFGEKTTVGENGIELGPVRPYLEVVDDLKRTLRTSFHVEVEERNVKEIIEQAQEEVCVKSWDTYKDVKAKVMAMAKELEIPTHNPARRRPSFLGGTGDNTRNSISDLARLSEIYDEERPNMPTSNIKDNPMFREQQAMIASLEVQLAEQKQVNVTHEQRAQTAEQRLTMVEELLGRCLSALENNATTEPPSGGAAPAPEHSIISRRFSHRSPHSPTQLHIPPGSSWRMG